MEDFDYDFDEGTGMDDSLEQFPQFERTNAFTQSQIQRMASWTRPFPLPDYMSPREDFHLDKVSDETLLTMPPQLLVHIQRTGAQGGLQVVSPRQTPITMLMGKTADVKRDIGDHVVGSTAVAEPYWPTLDDDAEELEQLLPDEPIPSKASETAIQTRTRTQPLSRASKLLKDPILACLIKGRAVIDILRRDDVAGDADAMTRLLADAWGIPHEELMEMDAYSIGVEGDMLRHAIQTDDVFPTVNAAIHRKYSVGVGYSEVTRDLLPANTALDWRRMRLVPISVFLMSCSIEGIPLTAVRCSPPPGDPAAPLDRPNILPFKLLPCTAWTFEPKSFSICPSYVRGQITQKAIPKEVYNAMTRYMAEVRPVSHATAAGQKATARRTTMVETQMALGEPLTTGYEFVSRDMSIGAARGRTSVAAVRNVIFQAMQDAPLHTRLRIARYLHIALDETKIHLGVNIVPDRMVKSLALKFLPIGELVRAKIVSEATRRGATADEWWDDMCAQVPERYAKAKEGTMGWAEAAMWLIFRGPTDKWVKLSKAVHHSALMSAEVDSVGSIALPAELGSVPRIEAAVRAAAGRISTVYSGYYRAVGDVAHSLADQLDEMGKSRSADTLREGAYLWGMRAGSLRGTNVSLIGHDQPTPSPNHLRISGPEADVLVKPAPYHAFTRYKGHVQVSKLIPNSVKKVIGAYMSPKISPLFEKLPRPILPCKESVITRYLVHPEQLARDLERSWGEIRSDIEKVVHVHGCGERPKVVPRKKKAPDVVIEDLGIVLRAPKKSSKRNYYSFMPEMGEDEVDWFEDVLAGLGSDVVDDLMAREYASMEEMRALFQAIEAGGIVAGGTVSETVR